MSPTLLPATDIRFADFVRAFNVAYQDYFIPIQIDPDQMRQIIRRDSVDLSASRVVLVEDEIVAVALLAKREKRGWIGGVGVIPEFRGKGIGRLIMQEILHVATTDGLEAVELEVIEGNIAAYNLYLSLGFQALRKLLIIETHTVSPLVEDITVRQVSAAHALSFHEQFHPQATPWQRHLSALRILAVDMDGWTAVKNGSVVAYAVALFSDRQIRFMDMGFSAGEEQALRAVVAFAQQNNPPTRFVNLAEDDPVWSVLAAMDYQVTMRQFHMVLPLKR